MTVFMYSGTQILANTQAWKELMWKLKQKRVIWNQLKKKEDSKLEKSFSYNISFKVKKKAVVWFFSQMVREFCL